MKSNAGRAALTPIDRWLTALAGRSPRIEPNFQTSGFRTVSADWRIERRILKDHLVYLLIDGAVEGTIGNTRVHFETGCLLWLPAGIVHEFRMRSGSPRLTLYHIRFRLIDRRPSGLRHWIVPNAWELRPYLEQIVDEIQTPGAHPVPRLRGLITLLFSSLVRMRTHASPQGVTLNSRQRHQIAEYAREHVRKRPTPAGLASELRLSHDYFSRIFRRTFGVAPRTWFMRERIRSASMALVESRATIKEIAFQHGYNDLYLFSRQFKQVVGIGPRAYRKQHVV